MNLLDQRLIDLALAEDLGPGDITTAGLIEPSARGRAALVARQELILAGMVTARTVFQRLEKQVEFYQALDDGQKAEPGQVLARITGSMQALLQAERCALNFLQRLSGIATLTRKYVTVLDKGGFKHVRLTDTRKTTPGWRVLEKYAVRTGGGHNHRMGLFDGILIKDNHIAAAGGVKEAVRRMRCKAGHLVKIEVETENLQQVRQALDAGAEVIMLDNMSLEDIRRAVKLISGRALVEVSGGVTLESLTQLAACGVDIISCGALTHSAPAVDISMELEPA